KEYNRKLLEEAHKMTDKEANKKLELAVKRNPERIRYNIFKPANLGKEKNPIIQAAYEMLFDRSEKFTKETNDFNNEYGKLLNKARHSRGFELVRQDKQVFDYLEGRI